MELTIIQKIAVYALPVIFAITVHEAAHGYVARYFGDPTAAQQGRITLNPIKHIDPIGTIVLPILTMLFSPLMFGWAKPVPVDFSRLRNPKKDMLWVAAAGPASNLIMAIFWAVLLGFAKSTPQNAVVFLTDMSMAGISINLVLMVLNLLPMPPLDGGRIAVSLLPMDLANKLSSIEPYGFIILIALMYFHILEKMISPPIYYLEKIILGIFS